MKSPLKYHILIIATLLSSVWSSHADEASYAKIVKERDRVLSQILAHRESKRSVGLGDEEAIAKAQLALFSFRRAVAPTISGKIKIQESIVAVFEKKLKHVNAKMKSGAATGLEVLEATDLVLEAKQKLEELRLKE